MLTTADTRDLLRKVYDHWTRLEAHVGETLALDGGFTRNNLGVALAKLEADVTGVVVGLSEGERAADVRDRSREAILIRFDQVRDGIKARHASTRHAAALPKKPFKSSSREALLKALDDLSEVWATLNADFTRIGVPLQVAGGYAQADLAIDIAQLRAAYDDVARAGGEIKTRRAVRSTPLAGLAKRAAQYRKLASSLLFNTDPLFATIP